MKLFDFHDFLEEAEDTLTAEYHQPISERKPEVCIVEVPSIVIVIETGFGYYTYPMLVIETKMNAEIRDWSSDVCAFFLKSRNLKSFNVFNT